MVRILAEDVVERLEEVLDLILEAVTAGRDRSAEDEARLHERTVSHHARRPDHPGAATRGGRERGQRQRPPQGSRPLAGHRWAGCGLGERIEQALAELVSARLVQRIHHQENRAACLTAPGRTTILAALGLEHLPPKTTWDKLKKTYLTAHAPGAAPVPQAQAARSFAGDPGFKAALSERRSTTCRWGTTRRSTRRSTPLRGRCWDSAPAGNST